MPNYFFIRTDHRYIKIHFHEIIYVEGRKNYIRIITDKKMYTILVSMKQMEDSLPKSIFRRIHRSFIVSLDQILSFDNETVYLSTGELPIGEQYKRTFFDNMPIIQHTSRFFKHLAIPAP